MAKVVETELPHHRLLLDQVKHLPKIYINGGRRGFLVGMNPGDVVRILSLTPVRVAI